MSDTYTPSPKAQAILDSLQPMFEEARDRGLFFFHGGFHAGPIWYSPDELAELHGQGKLIWGPVNWELRAPSELVKQKRRDAQRHRESAERCDKAADGLEKWIQEHGYS